MKALLSLLVLLLLTPAAGASPLEEGIAAYKAGDYEKAASLLLPIAEEGNPEAQLYAGLLYVYGYHVEKNPSLAILFFEKSAEQGNIKSIYNAGFFYYTGVDGKRDYDKALPFFERAAYLCDAQSQGMYGTMLALGQGADRNFSLGFAWIMLAAENGDPIAKEGFERLQKTATDKEKESAQGYYHEIKSSLNCTATNL